MTTEATARASTGVRIGDNVQAALTETERVCVDDICFDNIDTPTALAVVRSFLHEPQPRAPRQVSFANVHSISIARYDHELRYALHRADLVLPDGSGLSLAGRLNGLPVRENMNGTDFIPRVLDLLAHQKMSVFLLGGHPDVVSACREILTQRYPGLRIAGTHHGQFAGIDDQAIQEMIRIARPEVLLIALGSPLQEIWMTRVARQLPVRVCFTVGGLFDFLSGGKMRAPRWLQRLGLEWLFRFMMDPRAKWERVFVEIPWFLFRILTQQITVTRSSRRW